MCLLYMTADCSEWLTEPAEGEDWLLQTGSEQHLLQANKVTSLLSAYIVHTHMLQQLRLTGNAWSVTVSPRNWPMN